MSRGTEGATWPGAWALGCVIGLTFLLLALITAVIAQVLPTAVSGRSVAFAALGLFFLLRAVADAKDISWLNALTPLGLRALAAPFAGNHWGTLAAAGGACAALGSAALGLGARRDLGAGWLRPRARTARRLAVRSVLGLQRRLVGGSTLAWTLGLVCGGAAFIALGSSAVTATREGHVNSGFLGAQIGTTDPAAGYLGYTGTIIGIVAGVYAVLTVLGLAADETAGRAAQVLATGASRARLLTATLAASGLGTLLALTLTASAAALVAPRTLTGDHVAGQAFTQVIGQWPALLALVGLTGLAVGAGPRWRHLAWLPLALSAFLALLGKLLKLPKAVIDLGLFQHVPRLGSLGTPWPLAVLVALAALSAAGGLCFFLTRDLANG
ncbi:MAG: hypothetical protein ABSA53_27525 [Streptosporangiaceae bacterium]